MKALRKAASADEPIIVRERPKSFVSLYSNDIQVEITPYDFRLLLGVIVGVPTMENSTISIQTFGELRMSPQLAKKLISVLSEKLHHYEESVGVISYPRPSEMKQPNPKAR